MCKTQSCRKCHNCTDLVYAHCLRTKCRTCLPVWDLALVLAVLVLAVLVLAALVLAALVLVAMGVLVLAALALVAMEVLGQRRPPRGNLQVKHLS